MDICSVMSFQFGSRTNKSVKSSEISFRKGEDCGGKVGGGELQIPSAVFISINDLDPTIYACATSYGWGLIEHIFHSLYIYVSKMHFL